MARKLSKESADRGSVPRLPVVPVVGGSVMFRVSNEVIFGTVVPGTVVVLEYLHRVQSRMYCNVPDFVGMMVPGTGENCTVLRNSRSNTRSTLEFG